MAEPTVWMRARRWHTYLGRPIDEGDFYLAHDHMVETIEHLGFAVRDTAPPRAMRAAEQSGVPVTEPPTEVVPLQDPPDDLSDDDAPLDDAEDVPVDDEDDA